MNRSKSVKSVKSVRSIYEGPLSEVSFEKKVVIRGESDKNSGKNLMNSSISFKNKNLKNFQNGQNQSQKSMETLTIKKKVIDTQKSYPNRDE